MKITINLASMLPEPEVAFSVHTKIKGSCKHVTVKAGNDMKTAACCESFAAVLPTAIGQAKELQLTPRYQGLQKAHIANTMQTNAVLTSKMGPPPPWLTVLNHRSLLLHKLCSSLIRLGDVTAALRYFTTSRCSSPVLSRAVRKATLT
jgi:hypothetical protein